ncbi:DUF222 domain-containing protein [Microbacterium sp. P04]|uniref:HNH endonuclease signature motif containing protein n=1 Tax=Microbacterium sp. P04 TaxID=3366947 RepID=UPI003744B746
MNEPLDGIAEALAALRRAGGGRAPETLTPSELMAVNEAFGTLRRRMDAAYLPIAREINRQSRPELGKDSFAKKQGFRTPATLISATTGTSVGEAVRIVTVGDATAPRMTLTGESAPAKHPFVAAAVDAGRMGMAAASAIITMLDRVAFRVDRAALERAEQTLANAAPGLTLDQLQKLVQRAEAHLDPDGVAPHEAELRAGRSLVIREDQSGWVVLTGRFDPETGAPIKAAVEGLVAGMLRRRDEKSAAAANESCDGADATSAVRDLRSVKQMQADALSELCRHGQACKQVPTGVSTTVVVRMNLTDLESGVGFGTIDGITQLVSAATVRRMAADAQIIPCVLGGDSEILDWGRAKRLFTPAQKLASVERDGGCAGCGLPPSMSVVHHIRWWARDGGPTDLSNAVVLCASCHHRIHDDGWDIHVDGAGTKAGVWFIPPPWLDPSRTPRLGGRARYDFAA